MITKKSLVSRAAIGMVAIGALALSSCASTANPDDDTSAPGATTAPDAAAEDACAFFEGNTVDFLIPYGPGGGYDTLARMIIPGLENALDATVLPINMPGAGGLLAINKMTTEAPDGTTIAIVNGTGAAGAILAGAEGPAFGFDDLTYIGRVTVDDLVVVTSATGPYQTWDDIVASEGFRFGSTGRGSSDYIVGNSLIQAFDLEGAEVVAGFPSQPEIELAILQGNVDGIVSPIDSRRPGLVSGETTAVLSFADVAPADAGDAATFSEIELSEDAQDIIDGVNLLSAFGRTLLAPPGMDEATRACLEGALEAALEDPEVIEQAESLRFGFNYLSGEELRTDVITAYDTLSEDFLEILVSSY